MALTFDTTKVAGFPWDDESEEQRALRTRKVHALAFGGLYCGLGTITEASVDEWWRRISLYQSLFGPVTGGWFAMWEPVMLTREDVAAHIGLHTNVKPLSVTAFLRVMWDIHTDNMHRYQPDVDLANETVPA